METGPGGLGSWEGGGAFKLPRSPIQGPAGYCTGPTQPAKDQVVVHLPPGCAPSLAHTQHLAQALHGKEAQSSFFCFVFTLVFFFFFFFRLYLKHVEVPVPGMEAVPQQQPNLLQ